MGCIECWSVASRSCLSSIRDYACEACSLGGDIVHLSQKGIVYIEIETVVIEIVRHGACGR